MLRSVVGPDKLPTCQAYVMSGFLKVIVLVVIMQEVYERLISFRTNFDQRISTVVDKVWLFYSLVINLCKLLFQFFLGGFASAFLDHRLTNQVCIDLFFVLVDFWVGVCYIRQLWSEFSQ